MKSVSCRLHLQRWIKCQSWVTALLTILPCSIKLNQFLSQICDRNWFASGAGAPYLAMCLWRGLCLGHLLDWFTDCFLSLWSLKWVSPSRRVSGADSPCVLSTLRTDAFQTCLSVYSSKFHVLEILDVCLIECFAIQMIEHSVPTLRPVYLFYRWCSPNFIWSEGRERCDHDDPYKCCHLVGRQIFSSK